MCSIGALTNLPVSVMPLEASFGPEISSHFAVAAGFRILKMASRAVWPATFSSGLVSLH